MRKLRLSKQKRSWDRSLFILSLTLVILGLIAVADASAPEALSSFNDKYYFAKQQVIWGAVGLFLLFAFSKIHYLFWEKLALPIFLVSILCLIAVLIPGIGGQALGARRWIFLGTVSVQPSEFVKLALILYFAKLYSKGKGVLPYLLPLGVVLGLIMLEPDLGTALVITGAAMAQIFTSGINLLYLFAVMGVGGVGGLFLILVSGYRRARLLTFLQQTQDPLGKSYHIRQVLLALGSGGFFGVGLGASRQKYLFLPEATTDSIFAVIAEEVGFVGALAVLAVLAAFVARAFNISVRAPDAFSKMLAIGITSWIAVQIFLNIGSMVALVPLTGVPLPFFSYGGSALVMVLAGTGILLNISKYAKS